MKTKNIDRREFFKTAGNAALVMGGLGAVAGCGSEGKNTAATAIAAQPGEMTCRINSVNGDKVSILGYGCMRWPMVKDGNGKDIVDQASVDRLVDYAIEHGELFRHSSGISSGSERISNRIVSQEISSRKLLHSYKAFQLQ